MTHSRTRCRTRLVGLAGHRLRTAAPVGVAACRSDDPTAAATRPARPSGRYRIAAVPEAAPPRAAMVFADAALRRVLEVIDRRRPIAQLRPLLAPALIDTVIAMTRSSQTAAATLRPAAAVALTIGVTAKLAAEVFGTYSRGPRVRAIAARVEYTGERWRIVALQLG